MPRRAITALAVLAIAVVSSSSAQEKVGPEKPPPQAVLELLLPAGATATADGMDLVDPRLVTFTDLKTTEIRRVKLAVKFADGATDERLVEVTAGQRLPIPLPR